MYTIQSLHFTLCVIASVLSLFFICEGFTNYINLKGSHSETTYSKYI